MSASGIPPGKVRVGCAGWTISKVHAAHFPASGSHLERYAGRFDCVEINSSFYRPHRPATYARWAASAPEGFKFAVKVPKAITHVRRLAEVEFLLEDFLSEAGALGARLGPLLVQLPPSLAFNSRIAGSFCAALRERFAGSVVCEPRHASWFVPEVDRLLIEMEVARVAADPAPAPSAAEPGGWDGLVYYRLHGSPRVYYSAYEPEYLDTLARTLKAAAARSIPAWCIFDNTAAGAATVDALGLMERIRRD